MTYAPPTSFSSRAQGYSPGAAHPIRKQEEELEDDDARLLALLVLYQPRLQRAIADVLRTARRQVDVNELARLIERGDFDRFLTNTSATIANRIGARSSGVFVASGQSTAQLLSDALNVLSDFNQVNARAVAAMQRSQLELVQDFTREQRAATTAALAESLARGDNTRRQAESIRDSVGLTARQERAVQNYRRALERTAQGDRSALARSLRDRRFDQTVQNAAAAREPLSQEQIDRMVNRYRERYIGFRAETIARTETLRAVHSGNHEMYLQASEGENALFARQEIEQIWVTNVDGRERESHHLLNGVVRLIGQTFPGLAGPLRYPGDPSAPAEEVVNCRCSLRTQARILEAVNVAA